MPFQLANTWDVEKKIAAGDVIEIGKQRIMLADVEQRLAPFGRDGVVTETLVSAAQVVTR